MLKEKRGVIFPFNKEMHAVIRYVDLLGFNLVDAYDKIFTPQVTQDNLPQNRFGFMHYIPIPTLLVCGTSPRQGKFSLQLEIRRRLLERGINLGQIGTEPSAFLFGMYDISECGKEIILSGCQSAMLVREENYLFTYPLEQHSYLLGFQPDAIVLCVNMFDDIKFITRTISYLEGAVECKVIALVLYPQIYASPLSGIVLSDAKSENIDEAKERFSKATGLKVFTLGDYGDMEELVTSVISFFSE